MKTNSELLTFLESYMISPVLYESEEPKFSDEGA
jgi:hypothetical protein